MDHNARVLCLDSDAAVIREMQQINPEPAGIRHMLPKARHYVVKLENVRRPMAHVLKETFLSNGGDAVISREMITAAADYSDVILCATRKQYQRAFANLVEQAFGGNKIAAEIEAAIRHVDSPANTPDADSLPVHLRELYHSLGKRTLVMGILNVTPDSFSDGGSYADPAAAVDHARSMVENGADIIDIGGESTRPGSEPVSEDEEIRRVLPVIEALGGRVEVPISIDTCKSGVARAALDAGASIVNDVSAATFDEAMPAVIAQRRCSAILMHIKGKPKDMQVNPEYEDLMGEICRFLRDRIEALVQAGADHRLLIIDPGIGFGKTVEHNLEVLKRLKELRSIGRPILVGTSRKATIGRVLGDADPQDRLEGTAATVAIAIANGADIVRVHDVKEMARVATMTDAIVRG